MGATTTNAPLPERLFLAGFADLIPVIPPGATLAPSSKIAPSNIGKIPGQRLDNNLWVGMNWRKAVASVEDVRRWHQWGANVGLRADQFPGVDIDCAEPVLAKIIQDAAIAALGPAPVRIGNPPKRLLPYRLEGEPFSRLRLWLFNKDGKYLVEVLGQGSQYLVSGTHPKTLRPYEWSEDPAALGAKGLSKITKESAVAFLESVEEIAQMLGYETKREGDGGPMATRDVEQAWLLAPSMDELRKVVELLPNTDATFPTRTDWLKVGAAIRAAAGEENEPEAFNLFALWSEKWEGNETSPSGNDPDYTRSEWRRIRPPFSVGFSFLAEVARPYGYNDAPFTTGQTAPTPAEDLGAPYLSDQWLAIRVAELSQDVLRYVPAQGQWLVWDRGKWQPDANLLAEDVIKRALRKMAQRIDGVGASPKEMETNSKEARRMCNAKCSTDVGKLLASDRTIALSPEVLDTDPWLLNTPGGLVDLKTGKLLPPDPDKLCTKSTAVSPDFNQLTPEWFRFLNEATGGDQELRAYLQRLGGYALTGSTREQKFAFIFGLGGNGKGKFLEVLNGIFGDYAKQAPMNVFMASASEKHSTDLAMLQGARLVTASEPAAGQRWDDAKIKLLTGGDPITARFMRQDNITYKPQFKLIFIGNHKPEIRDIDPAMRRRIHLVPFTVTPKIVDGELGDKLRREWPGILAWFIQGALDWQDDGLSPPDIVNATTQDYFESQDPYGQWLDEATEQTSSNESVELQELFISWREWAKQHEQYVGKDGRLSDALEARKYTKKKHPKSRRVIFFGLRVKPWDGTLGGM